MQGYTAAKKMETTASHLLESEEAELELRDGCFLLSMFVFPGVTLSVEVERKSDNCRWRGDFTARYIEDITQRAGNVKSFANFVKMLRSATTARDSRKNSAMLSIDLLTYQDLELLKVGNGHAADKENISLSNVAAANKLYLILTYTTEFDRVHYPLPLLYEDFQETPAMRRCVQRLRTELESLKARLSKHEPVNGSCRQQTERLTSDKEDNTALGMNGSQDRYYKNKLSNSSSSSVVSTGSKLLETRALQEQLRGLQEKLRTERISHKTYIATLVRKNTILLEEARNARVTERRLSEKLRDSEFQIGLLRSRLKAHGLGNAISPFRSRPRPSASPPLSRPHTQPQHRRPSPPAPRFISPGRYSSSRSTTPVFKPTCTRSHSCPNMQVRKDTQLDEWLGRKPKLFAKATSTRRRPETQSADTLTRRHRGYASSREEEGHDVIVSEVGEIDSRLYALQDYLKKINHVGRK